MITFSKDDSSELNLPVTNVTKHHHLICLTLYNEDSLDLTNSLIGINQSIQQLSKSNPAHSKTLVTIIADGIDKLSDSVLSLFYKLGIDTNRIKKSFNTQSEYLSITDVTQSMSTWMEKSQYSESWKNTNIDILLCIKSHNRGKLDSHWWFLKKLCPYYQPEYCYQVDVGTILGPYALAAMEEQFKKTPSIAALSSNVLITCDHPGDLLEAYQAGDLAIQKAIMWPSESLLGYLSVVPGQYCGLRFKSLYQLSDNHQTPVDHYLRGSQCHSALEKTMFLAEDRVIGIELLIHQGADNRLEYCPDAYCDADTCLTMGELLSQRRRWINSAFMCRSWMMYNLKRYMQNSASPTLTKYHTLTSFMSMATSHILEWFQPFINLMIFAITFLSIDHITEQYQLNKSVSITVYMFIVLAWITPLLLAICGLFKKLSLKSTTWILRMVICVATFTFIINLFDGLYLNGGNKNTIPNYLISSFTILSLTLINSSIISPLNFKASLRSVTQYILLALPMNLMLFCYAFLNLDDVSWGTKGLSREQDKTDSEFKNLVPKLKKLRFWFVTSWLVSNALLFFIAFHYQLFYEITNAIIILGVILAITGLLGLIRLRIIQNTSDTSPVISPKKSTKDISEY